MLGLRTWWVDAVGTTALTLHVDPSSLLAGAVGGVLVAVICIWWMLRSLASFSSRSLLAGSGSGEKRGRVPFSGAASEKGTRPLLAPAALGLSALVLIAGASTGRVDRLVGFFGAGALSLAAMLCLAALAAPRPTGHPAGTWMVASSASARNATYHREERALHRPHRVRTFVIVAVEVKRDDTAALPIVTPAAEDLLFFDSLLPIVHDLSSAGRDV